MIELDRLDRGEPGPYVVRRTVRDGRRVIEKVVRDPNDERAASLLRHEHELLRRLSVPGVAIAIGFDDPGRAGGHGPPRLILDDAGPEDLATLLMSGPLEAGLFLALAIQMSRVIARVHESNVLHRNLSPASFVLATEAGARHVTLVGFEAATEAIGAIPPQHGSLSAYVAPELTGRLGRGPDQRADLYSLGAIFYEMLIGRPPFTQDNPIELIHALLAKNPIAPANVNPHIPQPLSDITLRLLAKAPEDRYQSANGLLYDLEEAQRRLRTTKTIASFELGREELVRELALPLGLYGREDALRFVTEAITRLDAGATALLVIAGPAGVGKSRVAGELAEHARRQGRFLSGKSDVLATRRPYASFHEVFGELIEELADAPESERLALRARVLEKAGSSSRVLVEFDPRLGQLLGETPPVPALGEPEAELRLHAALQSFVRAVAAERPLTLLFDDAQWADEATLKLVRVLLVDPERRSLLIGLTYRSEEITADHGTMRAIEAARTAGVPVQVLELKPLDVPSVTAFLADAFRATPEAVRSLAVELHRKTAGNPLFLRRLLHTLHRRFLLTYDPRAGSWSWDAARIAATPIADNVVNLLLATVEQLLPETQDALAAAACFGTHFELDEVAAVTGVSAEDTARALWPAIQEGLVVSTMPDRTSRDEQATATYAFAHDRIHQAAYSLRPPAERQRTHLRIGRALLAKAGPSTEFSIADQLNLASVLLTVPAERIELGELNLRAAEIAQRQSAHGSALAYLTHGLALLPEDGWSRHHALAFRLHQAAAVSASMVGELDRAEQIIDAALTSTDSREERAQLYTIRIMGTTIAGRFDDAIRILGDALPAFDIERPKDDIAGAAAHEMDLACTAIAIRGGELLAAPPMSPSDLLVLRLLVSALPASFYVDPFLQAWLSARIVSFTFAHGPATPACFAITMLSLALGGARRFRAADDVGKFAVHLAERLDSPAALVRASFLHASCIMPWIAPLRSCIPLLQVPVDDLLRLGEHQHAAWYVELLASLQFGQGVALDTVLATVDAGVLLTRKIGNSLSGSFFELFGSGLRRLGGGTSNEPPHLERASSVYICIYHSVLMQTSYLLGDLASAASAASKAERLVPALGGLPVVVPEFHLFAALTAAALVEGAPLEEKRRAAIRVRAHRDQFDEWAGLCPENFRHAVNLLDAELARIEDRPLDAARIYESAIDLAERDGFPHRVALANERCGRLHLGLGSRRVAEAFLAAAIRGYARWGATAKVHSLLREFPRLRGELRPATSPRTDVDLDVIGLLTAAETLASEVDIDPLLDKLMRTCLVTAGAERGLLILDGASVPCVRAAATEAGVSAQMTPLAAFADIPHAIIEDARRTERAIVLDDARRGPYAEDPDVRARAVRSVLAMPIRRAERTVCVLYLENNLLIDAFAPERVRALDLLSGHLAVALENSFLFESRRKAEAALRFLADASAALAESLDYRTTLTRVSHIVVPTLADMCTIELFEGGRIQQVAAAHVDPRKESILSSAASSLLDPTSPHPIAQVLRTGKPWSTTNVDEPTILALSRNATEVAAARSLGVKSVIIAPLQARGRTLGTIGVYGEQAGGMPRCDPGLVMELARRAGLAIDNARLYEETLATIRKRDEFLALASHELNTPLTSLQLALQPLCEERVQLSREKTAFAARNATRQVTRLTRLVGELLDVSRMRFGKFELVLEDVDLAEVAAAAAERMAEDLRRARCTLGLRTTSVIGRWDRSAIDRVVTNLLANAMKFGAGAPLELSIEADDANARLTVTDHGIGIPKDRLDGLFERFERAVSFQHYGGFGLGLYISRAIVETLGGTIRAESEGPGTGATFKVVLPRSQEDSGARTVGSS